MEPKQISLLYSATISELTEVNSSFDRGVMRVAYTGRNRNGSSISKEAFERALPTICNCPVVCNYDREENTIGGHDVELVHSEDGMQLVNVTEPVGVIPENSRFWWEAVEDESGQHEYLCVDVIVWKRQEAYKKIKENRITSESMEITVKSGKLVDNTYEIYDFEFTALCLLGGDENGIMPCFESAALQLFSLDELKAQYSEMIKDFKLAFSDAQQLVVANYQLPKGGKKDLDEKTTLMAEYGLSLEDLDFQLDDFELDQLKDKFEAIKAQKDAKFALTAEQFREELCTALCQEKITTDWGEMSRYWYCDYSADDMEVYCYDYESWNLYGFKYSMNGDHVVVDFSQKKRKKCSYVDFDEGEPAFSFSTVIDAVVSGMYASFEVERTAARKQAETMTAELETLRQFQTERLDQDRVQAEEAVFAKFPTLNGNEAFETLRNNCAGVEISDLEEKCYAILGRTQKFSVDPKEPAVPKLRVNPKQAESEPYGGLFTKYHK